MNRWKLTTGTSGAVGGCTPGTAGSGVTPTPAPGAVMAEAEAGVAAAIGRLHADGALPVCFLGGLGPEFERRLAPRYPGLVRPPRGTGLDGALAMARGLA